MSSLLEPQVVDSNIDNISDYKQCSCKICNGSCQWCNKSGCGMCSYCKDIRCPLCPFCIQQDIIYNPVDVTEKIKLNLTFDRFLLSIILILVGYIAWKQYHR